LKVENILEVIHRKEEMMDKKYFLVAVLFCFLSAIAFGQSSVRVWEESLILPTYRLDPPELNPMFFEHESYQG
jgi:hypothetical protein